MEKSASANQWIFPHFNRLQQQRQQYLKIILIKILSVAH